MNIFKKKKPQTANSPKPFSADETLLCLKAMDHLRKTGKISQQIFFELVGSILSEYEIPAELLKKLEKEIQTLK